eukprot:3270822-Pleurochrysis_carterae.AAC.2
MGVSASLDFAHLVFTTKLPTASGFFAGPGFGGAAHEFGGLSDAEPQGEAQSLSLRVSTCPTHLKHARLLRLRLDACTRPRSRMRNRRRILRRTPHSRFLASRSRMPRDTKSLPDACCAMHLLLMRAGNVKHAAQLEICAPASLR